RGYNLSAGRQVQDSGCWPTPSHFKVAEETAASEQQQKQEQQQEQQEVGTSPGSQHSDQTSAPIHINGQDMDASSDEGVVTEEVVIPRRVNTRLAEPWDSFSPIDVTTNG
ncbi:hypothetical protein OTU49_011945, partial [Cherax quadricarinatus]